MELEAARQEIRETTASTGAEREAEAGRRNLRPEDYEDHTGYENVREAEIVLSEALKRIVGSGITPDKCEGDQQ